MKFRKTIAGILCVIIFVMSTGCSGVAADPVEQVIDAINSSEYLTANEIYYEKISGNLSLENEVETQLTEIISNAVESYNNGEMTYDDALLILDVIDRADIYSYSSLSSSYTELENLLTSKSYYEEAVALEESGEYLDAYEAYEQVSSDDANYESAQSKRDEVLETLLDSLITEADELVANGEYETAQTILLSYLTIYIGSDEYWAELDFIDNSCMEALIADAEALVAERNYSEAYDVLLNEYSSFDFEGVDLYDAEVTKVASLWEAAVIDEAEEAFGSDKDYEAAILVLQRSGLTGDNIDAKIAEYQEYVPIALTSLEYTQRGKHIRIKPSSSSDYTDVEGNVYDAAGVIYPWTNTSSGDNYIVYYLNAEYSKLTGTLYRPYCTLQFSDEWASSVEIYGDGVLLYETKAVTSNTYETLNFEVDITGVRELKICMSGTLGVSVADGFAVLTTTSNPCVCATNLMISK
ncbi:MAG: NPCBM/NEW2 domain-containing protein [Oscillospiraceae bacterium]|nr:NPCBM/NEW2 domain-containing protein [Oscillospiraceae bacterium]